MIALGRGLVSAGHSVRLLVPEDFAPWGLEHGLDATRLNVAARSLITRETIESPLRTVFRQVRVFRQMAVEQVEATHDASENADLIVSAGGCFGACIAAQARRIPYRMVVYCPQQVRHDGWTSPAFGYHRWPRWLNRIGWAINRGIWNISLGSTLNAERQRLGLPLTRDVWHDVITDDPIIAADPQLTPDELKPKASGALVLPESSGLPESLERFLAAGQPPVYVGFGSMQTRAADKVTRIVVEAARLSGKRVILSRGWSGLGLDGLPESIHQVDDVPHDALFRRVAGVVHHGGAGTTHAALRAGVPQLIIPHMLDQFFWGALAHRGGLGPPPIPRTRVTARTLAEGFSSFDSGPLAARAAAASAQAVKDGTPAVVRQLEAAVRSAR